MTSTAQPRYRLRLAERFLAEATADFDGERWRACASYSQVAAENAGKAVLALLGMVGKTHDPATLIQAAVADGRFPAGLHETLSALVAAAAALGPEMHIRTDYGDEETLTTPWELFGPDEAKAVLADARAVVRLAETVVRDREGELGATQ